MATMTFSLGPLSRSFTLSDDDVARIQNWAQATYGSGTNAQLWDRAALGLANQLRRQVVNFERNTAGTTARDGITDIDLA